MNLKEDYLPLVKIQMVKEQILPYRKMELCDPKKTAELVRTITEFADREYMIVISLDAKLRPVCMEVISIGGLDTTIACPREVFKHAIVCGAYGIIMAHNHPSGDIEPSDDDKKLTDTMKRAGSILGISVLDHVIVGDNGRYYSMKEKGIWDKEI